MSMSDTPVAVKFTSPMAATMEPMVTTTMHRKSLYENFSGRDRR